jgi:hypothetical protein
MMMTAFRPTILGPSLPKAREGRVRSLTGSECKDEREVVSRRGAGEGRATNSPSWLRNTQVRIGSGSTGEMALELKLELSSDRNETV